VLIFKAVKTSSPKAYLCFNFSPCAVSSILSPVPSPFQGEGCPPGRGEDADERCPVRKVSFYFSLSFGKYEPKILVLPTP